MSAKATLKAMVSQVITWCCTCVFRIDSWLCTISRIFQAGSTETRRGLWNSVQLFPEYREVWGRNFWGVLLSVRGVREVPHFPPVQVSDWTDCRRGFRRDFRMFDCGQPWWTYIHLSKIGRGEEVGGGGSGDGRECPETLSLGEIRGE